MSTRRMISSKVCGSEAFLRLQPRAQAMYIQLVLNADADGFVDSALPARRAAGGPKSFQSLVEAGFLLELPGGVVLIRHWLQANSMPRRFSASCNYPALAEQIYVLPDKTYSLTPAKDSQTLSKCKEGREVKRHCAATEAGISEAPETAETKQNQKKQNQTQQNQTKANEAPAFQALWSAYPAERRGSESEAREAFAQEIPGHTALAQALNSLERWKSSEQWQREGGRFIPSLKNFLLRGAWRSPPTPNGLRASCTLGDAELEAIHMLLAQEAKEPKDIPKPMDIYTPCQGDTAPGGPL